MRDPIPMFRWQAQDAQRDSALGTIIMTSPVVLVWMSVAIACVAIAIMLFFVFGGYTRRVTVQGVVMPDTGLVKVYAPQAGIVLRKQVVEGQHVERGMVLYTVSADLQSAADGHTQAALIEQARRRKASLQQEQDKTRVLQQADRDTLEAKVSGMRADLARIDAQLAEQQQRIAIAADGVARYRRLLAQDYVSTDQLQQRQADLLDQQSKCLGLQRDRASLAQALRDATNELSGLTLRQQNQLAQIDRSVIDVDQTLIESEARREFVLTAPESGVSAAVTAEPGQTIDSAHPVASIVPQGARWQVHLFVPSAAVGFLHLGDSVRVRYQAYPYQKFGQYRARVISIARAALTQPELATSGILAAAVAPDKDTTFYLVTAAIDRQSVMAYGKQQPLQAGMTLQADILQEHRRLYEWVFEPLYSLTGKL
ncbi:HlyD family efflux transporter periplasmic adaptor subunit [Burkholderia sp. Ap-962]|uniref:HlyD family secretion protein n=1 Tax=Burkholderia sp. Ap-962 TaxID=2608333 RepID=UPI00141E6374|nr:HlyD family efflux transporter periplasmic adaptor subunit [Burkholderia sp. Ap-962]NIF73495.1 HlyD family efflux transporter periplasmic adaptor subunit [Burkholderia sp. Ap-962]